MLATALVFLRDELNSHLSARTGSDAVRARLTRLVDETGKYAFPEESLALTLVNLEEERVFRAQLPQHDYVDGQHVVREPELRLSLHVLVAANFKLYDEALRYLSLVLGFFQANPAFTSDAHPALDPAIGKLTAELQTLGYEQLNQIWAFVGAKQLPSVVYRVRLVAVQDRAPVVVRPPVTTIRGAIGGR